MSVTDWLAVAGVFGAWLLSLLGTVWKVSGWKTELLTELRVIKENHLAHLQQGLDRVENKIDDHVAGHWQP